MGTQGIRRDMRMVSYREESAKRAGPGNKRLGKSGLIREAVEALVADVVHLTTPLLLWRQMSRRIDIAVRSGETTRMARLT